MTLRARPGLGESGARVLRARSRTFYGSSSAPRHTVGVGDGPSGRRAGRDPAVDRQAPMIRLASAVGWLLSWAGGLMASTCRSSVAEARIARGFSGPPLLLVSTNHGGLDRRQAALFERLRRGQRPRESERPSLTPVSHPLDRAAAELIVVLDGAKLVEVARTRRAWPTRQYASSTPSGCGLSVIRLDLSLSHSLSNSFKLRLSSFALGRRYDPRITVDGLGSVWR